MELREHAKKVTEQISTILGTKLPEDQRLDIIHAVEKELISVVLEARNNCAKAALEMEAPYTDMAAEISRRIHRANHVLITNLSSMR